MTLVYSFSFSRGDLGASMGQGGMRPIWRKGTLARPGPGSDEHSPNSGMCGWKVNDKTQLAWGWAPTLASRKPFWSGKEMINLKGTIELSKTWTGLDIRQRGMFKGDLLMYLEDLKKNCPPGSGLVPPHPDSSPRVNWINTLSLSACPLFQYLLAHLQTVGDEVKLVNNRWASLAYTVATEGIRRNPDSKAGPVSMICPEVRSALHMTLLNGPSE